MTRCFSCSCPQPQVHATLRLRSQVQGPSIQLQFNLHRGPKMEGRIHFPGVELKMASPIALLSPCRLSFLPTRSRVGFAVATRSRLRCSSMSQVSSESVAEDVMVQYVVLRRDLIDTWPLGSVVTQGCHASVAAIWSHRDDPLTLQYCGPENLDSMHKVTLEVKGEPQILNLAEKLKAGDIAHKLWIEQPENIPTCLATKPYLKSVVSSYFKKLKLCK